MLVLNFILFIIFIIFDFLNKDSNSIKLLTTIVHLIYSFYTIKNIQMIKTFFYMLIGDYLLLFTHHYTIGIFFFILVQIQYSKLLNYQQYFPFILCILLIIDPLIALALIYLSYSLLNLFFAYKNKDHLFISLLLLLICDMIIGAGYLKIIDTSLIKYCWIFYFFSQYRFIMLQKRILVKILLFMVLTMMVTMFTTFATFSTSIT